MSPIEAYKLYVALHSHFTSHYDYFRYNGKTRANADNFHKRHDRYFFEKLAKHPDPKGLLISNLIEYDIHWVGDLFTADAKANYQAWKVRNEALTYTFEEDFKKLEDDFNSNFIGDPPTVIHLYQKEQITPETLCMLMRLTGCKKLWEKKLDELDPLWEDTKLLYEKYTPFIKYDLKTFKKLCLTYFSQYAINKDGPRLNTTNISNTKNTENTYVIYRPKEQSSRSARRPQQRAKQAYFQRSER